MRPALRRFGGAVARTIADFVNDGCMEQAAAIAFYTMFSLSPILLMAVAIAGAVYEPDRVRWQVDRQIEFMVGPQAAEQIATMMKESRETGSGVLGTAMSLAALVFGATGVLAQIQVALNRAWEVEPDPHQGGVKNFLLKRILSLAMILVIAFLLLVSLVVTTVIQELGDRLLPEGYSHSYLLTVNFLTGLTVITLLFATMYKVLPDAEIAWKDVWVGAIITTLLFLAGKYLIGFYLSKANVASGYGAAGALAIFLIWVYYAAMVFLLGAEFTQVYARRYGTGLHPVKGAVRTVVRKQRVRGSAGEEHGPSAKS